VLLGRWFWWPRVIHPRGDNARPPGPPPSEQTEPLAVRS